MVHTCCGGCLFQAVRNTVFPHTAWSLKRVGVTPHAVVRCFCTAHAGNFFERGGANGMHAFEGVPRSHSRAAMIF